VAVKNIESRDELQCALPNLRHETLIIDGDIALETELLTWWKTQKPHAALVILAAHSLRGDAASFRDIPACAYLHKPTDSQTLQHSLRMVLAARDQKEMPLITKHIVDEVQDQTGEQRFDASVLVAEDVVANQMVIRAMLTRCGVRVEFANNGLEAVQRCQQQAFDLVFMDCQMPELDGLSATRQIRRSQTHHTPIIALTANALQDDRGRCLDAGMDDFLAKPVKRKLLNDILQKWLPDKARSEVN
jgi:CheY-like chemotaxis protein